MSQICWEMPATFVTGRLLESFCAQLERDRHAPTRDQRRRGSAARCITQREAPPSKLQFIFCSRAGFVKAEVTASPRQCRRLARVKTGLWRLGKSSMTD